MLHKTCIKSADNPISIAITALLALVPRIPLARPSAIATAMFSALKLPFTAHSMIAMLPEILLFKIPWQTANFEYDSYRAIGLPKLPKAAPPPTHRLQRR